MSRPSPTLRSRSIGRASFQALLAAAACLALASGAAGAAPRPAEWQVYAIRYGTLPGFRVADLVAGADTTRTIDAAMAFWLLKGPGGKRVLVDAGFYRPTFLASWKPADYVRPDSALRALGVLPESVSDIVLTHVHWDHCDGADLFPNARVWIQRAEYGHYVNRVDGAALDAAIDSLDAAMLFRLNAAGRLRLEEGNGIEILPGITAYLGGKHTFASQFVGVRTAKGTVVLASDAVYLYENLDRRVPIAQTLSLEDNLATQDRMRRLASDPRLIVPGHDPAVFTRFPSAGPRAVRIE